MEISVSIACIVGDNDRMVSLRTILALKDTFILFIWKHDIKVLQSIKQPISLGRNDDES